jgi:NSS family neurotransmitter:Na+ symporter
MFACRQSSVYLICTNYTVVINKTEMKSAKSTRMSWGSYTAFLLAAAGSSVGLGNVWRFPSELGVHGGTYLYVYMACVLLVAFPLMIAELMIGRVGQADPVRSISNIATDERRGQSWQSIGWLGIFTSILIFSFYSIVAGWILFYIMQSLSGAFVNMPAEILQNSFGALIRNTNQQLLWHSVFVLLVVVVLTQEFRNGLERAVRFLMPLFIAFLVWLFVYVIQFGDYQQSIEFMFQFDPSRITPELFVSALSQSLFSLSVGIGILIMYGSYLSESRPLFIGAGAIMVFDMGIALLMSVIIFSIVFAFDIEPDTGTGLIFETLPVAFTQISEYGIWWSTAFFIFLFIAALTSGFALLEPSIAMLSKRTRLGRRAAAWLIGAVTWSIGYVAIYFFNSKQFSFYYYDQERLHGFFDGLNFLSIHILLPLTSLLVCIFVGWRMSRTTAKASLSMRPKIAFLFWLFCIRFVAPFILLTALIMVLFIPA